MKSIFFSFSVCFFVTLVQAQNPGGVAGSTLWLKANAGTSTVVNNATVSSWTSQAASPALSVTQATNALRPTFRTGAGTGTNNTANRFNYNPFIYTDGTSNRLVASGDINLGTTSTGMTAFQVIGQDIGIVSMEWNHSVNGNVKLKGDGNLYINGITGSEGTSNLNRAICPTTQQACIGAIFGQPTNVNGRYNGQVAVTDVGWSVGSTTGISIGSNVDNAEFMNGGMGEYIMFPSTLSAADVSRVQSYLAVKYAITLGTSAAPANYVSSSSTVIWSGLAPYQNNILGIGRDDASGLLQKQSHQYDDTVRIYKGTLATTNLTNASTFASNISYVMMGSTTGKLCSTAASNSEMPTGLTSCTLYSRLEREWRVVRTNMAEIFNMDVKLALCGVPGSVNVSDLRLLVDDDGNFSNGGTTCFYNGDGTGIVFSYTNPSITITGISTTHIPNNSARFITIASINSATPLPVELIDFKAFLNIENRTVELNWETASEMNSSNFSIEKSTDAENWNLVGIVQAAGFSSEQINYDTIDASPYFGLSYYRLQMMDLNGEVHYSAIRSVLNDSFLGMNVYPNPSKGSFILASDQINSCEIAFFDCFGRRVSYTVQVLDKDRVIITLTDLDSGIYTLQIQNESKYTYHKIQIIH